MTRRPVLIQGGATRRETSVTPPVVKRGGNPLPPSPRTRSGVHFAARRAAGGACETLAARWTPEHVWGDGWRGHMSRTPSRRTPGRSMTLRETQRLVARRNSGGAAPFIL